MTEISYITQNGERLNLKDAVGREMLAQKQPKLKAGNGITISPAGVISAVAGNSKIKTIVAENVEINGWGSWTDLLLDVTVDYVGNPALIAKQYGVLGESSSATYGFEDGYGIQIGTKENREVNDYIGYTFNEAIKERMLQEPATDDDFLIIFPRSIYSKSVALNSEGMQIDIPNGLDEGESVESNVVYIYFKDIGEEGYAMDAQVFYNYSDYDYSEESWDWYYKDDEGNIGVVSNPSGYKVLAMMIKDLLK